MAYCSKCGTQIPEGSKFCLNCGNEINSPITQQSEIKTEAKENKKKRSILWFIVSLISLCLGLFAWVVKSPAITIIVALVSLALGIISLVMKARFRAVAIIAIVVSGVLLIAWGIQGAIDATEEKEKEVIDQTVSIKEMEYTIPGYYEFSEKSTEETKIYSVSDGDEGAFLDLVYVNAYNDGGTTAALLAANESTLKENQALLDSVIEETLDSTMKIAIGSVAASKDIEFVKNHEMAGNKAKEYKFTGTENGVIFVGHAVGSFDLMTGDFYAVLLAEPEGSEKGYINKLDEIILSARKIGTTKDGLAKSNKSNGNETSSAQEGVTPSFKETMDAYEAFFDEYLEFMEKYQSSTDTLGMLSDYSNYLTKYAEAMEKMSTVDTNSLSPADYAYYIEVTTRVTQKLSRVVY